MHFDSFDNQISAKLSFTVQTFKKQNSMDMEKYNGLMIDVHYLVRQPQINNGIVIINFADNNAFVLYVIICYTFSCFFAFLVLFCRVTDT